MLRAALSRSVLFTEWPSTFSTLNSLNNLNPQQPQLTRLTSFLSKLLKKNRQPVQTSEFCVLSG